jgi:uncharacterized protein (DUF3084 family)
LRAITGPIGAVPGRASTVEVADTPSGLDSGLTDFGERFADAQNDQLGPALEIEAPRAAREPERKPAAPTPEDPAAVQARKIKQLAGYGAPPQKLLQAVPYFFRVAARKRRLQAQVAALTLARKQLEHKAEDALCALGEALYAQRDEPRLTALAPQFKVVHETRQQIGSHAAASKRGVQAQKRELEALIQQARQLKQETVPFDARASELSARLEVGRAKTRNLEQQLRKAEVEQNALKGSTQPAALEQIAALELLREAARGELQSLNVELVPSRDDLADVKREIARRADALAQLSEQQQRLSETADRNDYRQRIAAGGALSAHREALRSLANAAMRNQLAELAQHALKSASAAEAPIAAQRQDEDLLRKALSSYDHAAYQRGMQLAAGAVLGTFMLFLLLIAF